LRAFWCAGGFLAEARCNDVDYFFTDHKVFGLVVGEAGRTSSHNALSIAKEQARPVPKIHEKYHMILNSS